MNRQVIGGVLALVLLLVGQATGEPTKSPLSLTQDTIRPGSGDPANKLIVKGEGLPATCTLTAEDKGGPSPPTVAFDQPTGLPGTSDRYWTLGATVQGFTGTDNLKRYVYLACTEGQSVKAAALLSYVIKGPSKPTLTIGGSPPPLYLRHGHATSVAVTATGASVPVPVRISRSELSAGGVPLGLEHLELCRETGPSCKTPELDPGLPTPIFIKVRKTFNQVGKFEGALWLAVDGGGEYRIEKVTVTSVWAHACLLGVALLVVGVVVGWWATRMARGQLALAQARLMARDLGDQLSKLEGRRAVIAQNIAAVPLANLQLLIAAELKKLADAELKKKLWPALGSRLGGVTDDGLRALKAHLEESDKQTAIATIVTDGLEIAADRWQANPPNREKIESAMRDLDSKDLPGLTNAVAARLAVAKLLSAAGLTDAFLATTLRDGVPDRPALRLHVAAINVMLWLIWAGLTVAAGYFLFIDGQPAFGAANIDFFKCLAWGFGVQVTTNSLGPGAFNPILLGGSR